MKIRRERKKKDKTVTQVMSGSRPDGEIGLPENIRVMHAEEHNPHDG